MKSATAILFICLSLRVVSQDIDRCATILLKAITSSPNFLSSFNELYPDSAEQYLQNAILNNQLVTVVEGKVLSASFDNYCQTTADSLIQMHLAYREGLCLAMTFGTYVLDLVHGELYDVWAPYDETGALLAPEDISIILWEHPIRFSSDELYVLKRCW